MPIVTVSAKPAIAASDALPLRDASAYRPRCMKRTPAYVTAKSVASSSNASGSARPAMKISSVAAKRTALSVADSVSWALAAQTKADHAHQTSARTSIALPNPAHERSWASSVVTCVTAKTKTRSHRSSTGLVRRSSLIARRGYELAIRATRAAPR